MGNGGGGNIFVFNEVENVSTEKLPETAKCLIGDFQMQDHLGAR